MHVSGLETVAEQREAVAAGRVTSRELVERSLGRIATLDPVLNAFSHVTAEAALEEAGRRDAAVADGEALGPLHGVPVAVKDDLDVRGLPTAIGGEAGTVPRTDDAVAVARLRAAGAVIVGKTRMPELGVWAYTGSRAHGWTRNPWDPARTTGGSSGGSAAAVASGMVAAALGTDGGGSIRFPAALCGVVGVKPGRGRVSTAPLPDIWGPLGVIGPLARTVLDAAIMLDAVAGSLPDDRFTAVPWGEHCEAAIHAGAAPLTIALSSSAPAPTPRPSAAIVAALDAAAEYAAAAGHRVVHRRLRYPELTGPLFVEVAAGMAATRERLDRPDLLERRTRDLIRLTAPLRGRVRWAERRLDRADAFVRRLFADVDLLLMPVAASVAPRTASLPRRGAVRGAAAAASATAFTQVWNLLGCPAMTVPAGLDAHGLPVAVQLVAPAGGESRMLAVAAQLEESLGVLPLPDAG